MPSARQPLFVLRLLLVALLPSHALVAAQVSLPDATIAPLKYYYGEDQAMVRAGQSAVLLVFLAIVAVALEYMLARLKAKDGTYSKIVAASVMQETLIVGMVTMFFVGLLTAMSIRPLYVLVVRSAVAGLILMVLVFVAFVVLLTLGLLWGRRRWTAFERTRMASDTYGQSATTTVAGNAAALAAAGNTNAVNEDDDEKGPSIASAMRRSRTEVGGQTSLQDVFAPSAATSARSNTTPMNMEWNRTNDGGGGPRKTALVYHPEAPSARRATLVLPYDNDGNGAGMDDSNEMRDGADEGRRLGKRVVRRMHGFSSREKVFTRCRDLWAETLERRKLYSRQQEGRTATAAELRDDEELIFSEYLWKLMPHVMSLLADFSWKSWIVLALFVAIDGVRAVIVLGDNTTVSTEVLTTSIASFVFLGGLLPLGCYGALAYKLQSGVEKVARKPLMRRHERESKPRMMRSSDELFFRSLDTTIQMFQLLLLEFEWYVAFFYLNFSEPIFQEYGSVSMLIYLGAALPVIVFLHQMPWTLMMIASLTGLGADLDPNTIQGMRDDLKAARGELTEKVIEQLQEYERDLPGEWNVPGQQELTLHHHHPQHNNKDLSHQDQHDDLTSHRSMQRSPTIGTTMATAASVRVKPPDPAFRMLLPPNHLLPHEREYFSRFADPDTSRFTRAGSDDDSDDDDDDI